MDKFGMLRNLKKADKAEGSRKNGTKGTRRRKVTWGKYIKELFKTE